MNYYCQNHSCRDLQGVHHERSALRYIVVVMAHNLLGLAVGFLTGRLLRLPKPKCVAVSIEVGMQNSGLASSLAVLHFAAYPLATIPGAVFSVWHNISGALVAKLFAGPASQTNK